MGEGSPPILDSPGCHVRYGGEDNYETQDLNSNLRIIQTLQRLQNPNKDAIPKQDYLSVNLSDAFQMYKNDIKSKSLKPLKVMLSALRIV